MNNIQEITCPQCGSVNNHLLTNCKTCGVNLLEIGQMQQRLAALENAGAEFLKGKTYWKALRVYSVLLEYRPRSPKYLKRYCLSCIHLGAFDEAKSVIRELEKRLKNDSEVKRLKEAVQKHNA